MHRRKLLKWGGALGLGSFFGNMPQAESAPNPPLIILPFYDNDPLTLEGRDRSVLIIGGGLAGMSAALELAERGYKVQLKEASSVLGGR